MLNTRNGSSLVAAWLAHIIQRRAETAARLKRWHIDGSNLQRTCLIFFCILAAQIALSGQPLLLWRLWRISEAPVSTTGVITALDCRNHGHVTYSFAVGGVDFAPRQPIVDGVDCRTFKLGQRVGVDYEKGRPENNYAFSETEPTANRARNAMLAAIAVFSFALLVGPFFLTMLWRAALKLTRLR